MELKLGYQLTEVGIIPEDWEVAKISDVCRLVNGRGFKPFEWQTVGLPIIRIQNLNGSADFNYYSGQYDPKILVEHGQLLFAWSGSRGTSFGPHVWNGGRALLNYHTWKVVVNDSKVTLDFLLYALRQLTSYIEDRAHGASALVHTQKWEMEKFPIVKPPSLPEQRAIATALSDVDGLLSGLDRLITKKRDIKQAAMQQLLTGQTRLSGFYGEWEVQRLETVAEIVMGQSPSSSNYNTNGAGLPLIQGNADIDNRKTIKRIFTTQITKRGKRGDILMSVRAPVGEVSRAVFDVCLGRGVCAIRYRNDFMYHCLIYLEPSWVKHSKGSTFDSVNSADVKALEVRLPADITEQTAIAGVLSEMDAELAALEQRREKTLALKRAMMQELLTGRIRLLTSKSNIIPIPEPKRARAATSPSHNWQINEAVIIGVLAKQFGTMQWPLPRKRRVKLTYLLHRHVEGKAEGYLKKAAGPYNPATKYKGPEAIALRNKYVREQNNGKYSGFIAAENIAQAEMYFLEWYPTASAWLEQFRFETTDELELLATVDMAAEDLRSSRKGVDLSTVKGVIHDHPEWEAKLDRPIFSDDNIARAINVCARLFP